MNNDKKRLITFFAITVIFMMFWQQWYVEPLAEERRVWEERQAQSDAAGKLTLQNVLKGQVIGRNLIEESQNVDSLSSKRIKITNDKIRGSISLRGARFDDITLSEFKQSLDENSADEILLSQTGNKNSYFVELGWLSVKGVSPDANTLWGADNDQLDIGQPVTLTWDNGVGQLFKRVIALDENYLFTVTDSIANTGPRVVGVTSYGRINRARAEAQTLYISHEGPLAVIDKVLEEVTYDDLQDDRKVRFDSGNGWIGFGDKYWLTAILPSNGTDISVESTYYNSKDEHRYQIDYRGEALAIAPGQTVDVTRHVFAGAKKVEVLNKYSEDLDIALFDRAIDYGWLYFLTKPMFAMLLFFYDWIGNFGLAILSLTVLVKLVLFPLASKSYRSFARMRLYMPEMTKIKERNKDDRMKLNQEMMDFYKKNRINPAAGCLPMLVQLPVFFALYKVLYVSIEMRHAPFYGWIEDLSVNDPTSVFNLFGLIPVDLPAFLPVIGAWPLLYAISMVIQQKLNPPPSDPSQALMMKFLPWVFLFIFAGFPAGLVIYWVWNNVLSIAQQYVITRKINADPQYNVEKPSQKKGK